MSPTHLTHHRQTRDYRIPLLLLLRCWSSSSTAQQESGSSTTSIPATPSRSSPASSASPTSSTPARPSRSSQTRSRPLAVRNASSPSPSSRSSSSACCSGEPAAALSLTGVRPRAHPRRSRRQPLRPPRFHYVVDFLEVHIVHYHWPDFNVADSALHPVIGRLPSCLSSRNASAAQPSRPTDATLKLTEN